MVYYSYGSISLIIFNKEVAYKELGWVLRHLFIPEICRSSLGNPRIFQTHSSSEYESLLPEGLKKPRGFLLPYPLGNNQDKT